MTAAPTPPLPAGTPTQVCERCGTSMRCGMNAGDEACWCAALPHIEPGQLRRPDGTAWSACLCPACLGTLIGEASAP